MAKKKNKKEQYHLVIVESPAKANTINKYLGNHYKVTSSMGHVIDLPKSRLGIKIENQFEPEYITVRGKGKILAELKKLALNSKTVLLASDNDREGEAISFLIKEELLKKKPGLIIKRIVFNEITKSAIIEAVEHPREIDTDMVNAQKTRRILDRIVGYNISPILWEKVKNGLSAGRVQSVTLKIICSREQEREAFVPEEYWTLEALFKKNKNEFSAELFKIDGEKPSLKCANEINNLIDSLDRNSFTVFALQESVKVVRPQAPFITSKLQQTASNKLNFNSRKTMQIAQQLYEGINIGKEILGLITYMRTDSVRIADSALLEVRDFINGKYPDSLPEKFNFYGKSDSAQDAHEGIRPTSAFRTPHDMKEFLTADQYKLYTIIWERFVSSQMTNAEYLTQTVIIKNGKAQFKTSRSSLKTPGFTAALDKLKTPESDEGKKLPALIENEILDFIDFVPKQHFTQAPPRYNDASIIKFLEENGIGRPSTYAPTISTLLNRYYIIRKGKQFIPTVLGKLVNKIICDKFPEIVDVEFTAKMEEELDHIANGKSTSNTLLNRFYQPFKNKVDEASKNLEDHKKIFDEITGEICEKCGKPMLKKLGRFGFFHACSGFPECRNSKTIPLADCPKEGCSGKVIPKRKIRGGKEFYGCTNYPQCDFVSWFKPTEFKCPKCEKFLVEKNDKVHGEYKICIDENCGYKQLIEN